MMQYTMIVITVSLVDYVDEASPHRRELAALLEQGYAIVAVTTTLVDDVAASLVVTLQAPIRAPETIE